MINKVFGKLTVIGLSDKKGSDGRKMWDCICSCGGKITVLDNNLKSGKTKSCGCLQKEISSKLILEHHRKRIKTPKRGLVKNNITYSSWCHMVQRCTNPKNDAWKRYGGRLDKDGNPDPITVCNRWLNPINGFKNFLADMGERPSKKYSIERKDGTKGYCPENCSWKDKIAQNNNMSSNVILNYEGEEYTGGQLARKLGLNYPLFKHRVMEQKWDIKRALNTAPQGMSIILVDSFGYSYDDFNKLKKVPDLLSKVEEELNRNNFYPTEFYFFRYVNRYTVMISCSLD